MAGKFLLLTWHFLPTRGRAWVYENNSAFLGFLNIAAKLSGPYP